MPLLHGGLIQPTLSRPLAILSCSLYTFSYVGSLYIFRATRVGGGLKDEEGKQLTRDHPKVIKARLRGVFLSTVASVGATYLILERYFLGNMGASIPEKLNVFRTLMGFCLPQNSQGVAATLALTAALFLGPIYTTFLDKSLPGQSRFVWHLDVVDRFTSLTGFRNYFAGPLTEEIVFRSCVIATSALSSQSTNNLIFLSPLYFGIAHAHHAREVYANNGKTRGALVQGLVSAAFQFAYTTLFGWYASYLFVKSGSIMPPLAAHVFCNIAGFPQLPLALHNHPNRKAAIWSTYGLGIAAFIGLFKSFTSTSIFGPSFYWRV